MAADGMNPKKIQLEEGKPDSENHLLKKMPPAMTESSCQIHSP
jgi:hypothetical protein